MTLVEKYNNSLNREEKEKLFEEILNTREQDKRAFFLKFNNILSKIAGKLGSIHFSGISNIRESSDNDIDIIHKHYDNLIKLLNTFNHYRFNKESFSLDFNEFKKACEKTWKGMNECLNDITIENIITPNDFIDASPYIKEQLNKAKNILIQLNTQLEQFGVKIDI